MKVRITGHVFDGKGRLEGIVDMDESESARLIDLGVAQMVAEEIPSEDVPVDEPGDENADTDTGTTQQAPAKTNKKKSKA